MRGGKRQGAGRKPGALTVKTRKIAEIAVKDGITPLEVMLAAMHAAAKAQNWMKAVSIAQIAAPYMHPKLAAVEHTGANGGALVPSKIELVFV